MLAAEVIIVGGGPAGSSCAWRLQRHGMECMVLDRQAFLREKQCGGRINAGTGAIADKLTRRGEDIKSHWHHCISANLRGRNRRKDRRIHIAYLLDSHNL